MTGPHELPQRKAGWLFPWPVCSRAARWLHNHITPRIVDETKRITL